MKLSLYKIPGSYVYAFLGKFGTGKSLTMLEQGLIAANHFKKSLRLNFWVDEIKLRQWCLSYGLEWFARCGRLSHSLSMEDLFNSENSVILVDEAALEFFSRSFQSKSAANFWDKIFRIRHYRNVLFYAAQHWAQIDKQLRSCTHEIIWLDGFQKYSAAKKLSTLILRKQFVFTAFDFENYQDRCVGKLFYPIWKSGFRFAFDFPLLSLRLQRLFRCYNSFDSKKKIKARKLPSCGTKFNLGDLL